MASDNAHKFIIVEETVYQVKNDPELIQNLSSILNNFVDEEALITDWQISDVNPSLITKTYDDLRLMITKLYFGLNDMQ